MRADWLQRRVGVLAERNFRCFYAGFVTSLLGSSMSTVAIAFAVLDSRVSATGLGLVFSANVVPQVLLLPLAGAIADRLGRRRVMLAADVLRCGAQATLAAALALGRPALWLFVLLAWLGGTGTAFFTPALDALTVEIAPRDQLGNANSLYGLASSATRIAGPALGGILVAVAGSAVVVAADAASYAVSVLALSLLHLPAAEPAKPVKVFILAGQSNMEGHSVADLDGKNYNEGKGTLGQIAQNPVLYDNLSKTLNDTGQLITAIRKDPKTYLTVHVKVF